MASFSIMPVRRDLQFQIPQTKINDWHGHGPHVAIFMNTLSMFFPEGERFFIHSVRHYRTKGLIEDQRLLEQVKAFIGQEAMHGREHDDYNEAVAKSGLPIETQEALVTALLERAKQLPPSMQLGATIALEHFTAILANQVFAEPELLPEGTDENMRALWNWHAIEETEHKSVAFDTYRAVMGKTLTAYGVRVTAMVMATAIFFALLYPFYVQNVYKSGHFWSLRGWRKTLKFQIGSIGILRKIVPDYLDYFKPGFHPWDHDNSHYLQQIDTLVDEAQRLAGAA